MDALGDLGYEGVPLSEVIVVQGGSCENELARLMVDWVRMKNEDGGLEEEGKMKEKWIVMLEGIRFDFVGFWTFLRF